MALTRKQFLSSASLLALGAAGLVPLRAADLLSPRSGIDPSGPMTQRDVLSILMDAVSSLIGVPIEIEHYREHIGWRWQNVPGAKDGYEEAARALELAAQESAGRPFMLCSEPEKDEALRRAPLPPDLRDDVLLLFSETDAWLLSGYDFWPADPRGLSDYSKPPRPRG
jgi:hypothetical protein